MKKYIKTFFSKCMISIIIFLLYLIGRNKINNFDNYIYENVYNKNISFAKFNKWYNEKFGTFFPINNIGESIIEVFNEKLDYKDFKDYKDGVILTVEKNYLVPFIDDGIVIFKGKKKDYDNVIIVQNQDGLDIWYCDIVNDNIELYEYVKKGDYIGEVKDDKLILAFFKNGEKENYKKYI